ncbi:MAG: 30S ribosomal protein S4 [Bacteroidota bacterium]
MARYKGPKSKISRKFREPIFGFSKALERKNYHPGQHGKKRKTESQYGIQLKEKQKPKYIYGILEKPFRNLFKKAVKQKGITGEVLLQLLELRLDNIVFRLGIAKTRRFARQLVSHKHIQINGKTVNIPSYHVKVGDIITLQNKSKNLDLIQENLKAPRKKYGWLAWDANMLQGKLLQIPERASIPEKINGQSIVEFYSK